MASPTAVASLPTRSIRQLPSLWRVACREMLPLVMLIEEPLVMNRKLAVPSELTVSVSDVPG